MLENQAQVDDLIENGFIKDSAWDLTSPPPRPSMSMAQSKKPVSADPPKEDVNAGKDVVVAMDDVRWYVGETLYLQLIDNSAV